MAKFTAISLDDVEPSSTYAVDRDVTGVVWSKRLSPDGYSLWLVVSALDDGAVLRWDDGHGDEAVCVLEGALDLDGRRCPEDGALIVESGATCESRAVGPTVVAHYGPTEAAPPSAGPFGAPAAEGHAAHVVGDKGWFRAASEGEYEIVWWADSSCPTCRISVFRVNHPANDDRELPHHHGQDEIIFLREGRLGMGARTYGPGTALSIPAGMRYAVRGVGEEYTFLNYRRDTSSYHGADGGEPVLEVAAGIGVEVGDLR